MVIHRTVCIALVALAACPKSPSTPPTTPQPTTAAGTTPSGPVASAQVPAARTGALAQGCTDTPCFVADSTVMMSCKRGPTNPAQWSSQHSIQGVSRGGCVVYRDAGGADINMQVLPTEQGNASELFIRLKDYKGPGRYKLVDEADRGAANRGFYLRANGGVPDKWSTMGATECTPGCEAIVTERSEALAAPGQVFKLDIDVVCSGGTLDDGKPCNNHASCTLDRWTVHVEAVCRG